jgi:hypothetical protein
MRWYTAVALGCIGWIAYRTLRNPYALAPVHGDSGNGDGPESWDLGLQAQPVPLHLVRWYVRVPPSTPANAPVYLCGGHPVVGEWNPRGLPLLPVEPNLYCGALQVPAGTSFEYKFTRGSWESVETRMDGGEHPNRIFVTAAPATVHDEVEAWSDRR